MVNTVNCYMSILRTTMKLAGMQPTEVEIEPGTVIHFWVNDTTRVEENKKAKKQPAPPPRPPVVLIQGFLGDGLLTWQFQILPLIKKYSLYIPDLFFFGGSHTDKTDRSTRFQADCIAKGLKKLGVVNEKCVVVGFSYGGFVGFQMAQYYPELVGSMVVCGSALALSETITRRSLERIGFSSWPEFLLPVSVEGVKVLLETSSYSLPWLPGFFYKHFLERSHDTLHHLPAVEAHSSQMVGHGTHLHLPAEPLHWPSLLKPHNSFHQVLLLLLCFLMGSLKNHWIEQLNLC